MDWHPYFLARCCLPIDSVCVKYFRNKSPFDFMRSSIFAIDNAFTPKVIWSKKGSVGWMSRKETLLNIFCFFISFSKQFEINFIFIVRNQDDGRHRTTRLGRFECGRETAVMHQGGCVKSRTVTFDIIILQVYESLWVCVFFSFIYWLLSDVSLSINWV